MQAPQKVTLLVVEDDAKLRSVLERTLTFEGYDVTSCSDGVGGLEALTGSAFDAVIMDVSMPNLDGVGLCRRMRERGHTEPVLFLTARITHNPEIAELFPRAVSIRDGQIEHDTGPTHTTATP